VVEVSRELYPFESHFLDRGGLRYHYLDEGAPDADPVVMVHGNPSWSFYYRNLARDLRADHRVIVPDHIGMGLSDKPGDAAYDYTLERRAEDLGALIDHCGLGDRITLVLHDWGGMIGMLWASRNVARVARLVLLNTAAFHLPAAKPLPMALKMVRTNPIGPLLVRGWNAMSKSAVKWCCTRTPMSKEVAAGYLAPYDSWANRIGVLRFVQDIPLRKGDRGYDLVTEVQEGLDRFAAVPKLICWGMQDWVFDHHFLAEWERRCPEAEVHRFDDAGHYILEDADAEVRPLIRDFLARHPLAAGGGA
jgi:haloalkane dehalogenase